MSITNERVVMSDVKVLHGDCVELMRAMPDCSVDSVVTDPPYEREVVGYSRGVGVSADDNKFGGINRGAVGIKQVGVDVPVTAAATEEARRWQGWGTALKPAHEPIVVARKPLVGTVAQNVLEWGTGGLNIDGCRVGTEQVTIDTFDNGAKPWGNASGEPFTSRQSEGRWPANVVFDVAAGEALDQQSGTLSSGVGAVRRKPHQTTSMSGRLAITDEPEVSYGDRGGASRFFTQADFGADDWPFVYQAKSSKKERNAGVDGANLHPTVKPVALMRHLVRLVTPPNGTVLDPFAGSGTTLVAAVLEGFNAVGCEITDEYLPIIDGRVAYAQQKVATIDPVTPSLF
jgi:hypothetical protein